jgi:hypothetical protein
MFNSGLIFVRDRRLLFCRLSEQARHLHSLRLHGYRELFDAGKDAGRSVKLNACFRVEVQNDGRSTSSPPYVLMNYVNALGNASRIAEAYFCLSHSGFLHTQQQLRSNAFEQKLLLNKAIGYIITIPSLMRRS